jgi:SAM-dependent methyltransferase
VNELRRSRHLAHPSTNLELLLSPMLFLVFAGCMTMVQAETESAPDPQAHWDNLFRQLSYREVEASASFPAYCAERLLGEGRLAPGAKVLMLAMGDGRNAVYFAQQGFEVTGLDISTVAIERAVRAAAQEGVEIHTIHGDLFKSDFGNDRWDLVTNIQFNPAIKVIDRIKRAVRPGGYLLIEGYGSDLEGAGPPEWSRYRPNQLLDELPGWRILEYQDGVFPNFWAGDKRVPVVRILARKPTR